MRPSNQLDGRFSFWLTSYAVYKAVWSSQPGDKVGQITPCSTKKEGDKIREQPEVMEEGGAGFRTPTFWSRNEAKHNSRVRTCKSKADNTKGKV